jgi:hypothetical protein
MQRLQRVLASNVLRALQARDHVEISPASTDAITDEMEAVIAPTVLDLQVVLDRHASSRPTGDGSDALPIDQDPLATDQDAVETMVDRITARLLESDHVDDIHADDRVLRRDAFRAIRKSLLGYMRGDIAVDQSHRHEADEFNVLLDGLGYVVASVANSVDADLLAEALERAAAANSGRFCALDVERLVATFELPGGAAVGRLTFEEAVTEELVALVEAELVDLPRVEQVLELDRPTALSPGFGEAVARAEARLRAETGSAATCTVIDDCTIIATFTPFSQDAAEHADLHFATFLSELERALASLSSQGQDPHAEAPLEDETVGEHLDESPKSGARKKRRPAQSRSPESTSRRAPRSSPRGKKAPRGRSSQTRSTAPPKKTRRRKAKG